MDGWTVGFDLLRSTGIERTTEIARYLNENLGKLCLASVKRTFESKYWMLVLANDRFWPKAAAEVPR